MTMTVTPDRFKVSVKIEGRNLSLKFKWHLPSKDDQKAIQRLTHEIERVVMKAGGTVGQMNAASKEFRSAGYYIKGPHK